MADKLGVYNSVLRRLGERKLASLSENNEARRTLDDLWDQTLVYCLEQGQWAFAIRAVKLEASTSITPSFGYDYAVLVPADYVRTAAISGSESHDFPLDDYQQEAGYWFTRINPLYVRYVSKDSGYGLDLSRWPETYAEYVTLRMARLSCESITQGASKYEMLVVEERKARVDALSKDAMNKPVIYPPAGSWLTSRRVTGRGM